MQKNIVQETITIFMKKLLLLLILSFSSTIFSQNIRFEGTVKDSSGVGLDMANIMAVNQATKAMDAYAISNESGKFSLVLKANTTYTIKASYIGFQSFEKTVTTGTTTINYLKPLMFLLSPLGLILVQELNHCTELHTSEFQMVGWSGC